MPTHKDDIGIVANFVLTSPNECGRSPVESKFLVGLEVDSTTVKVTRRFRCLLPATPSRRPGKTKTGRLWTYVRDDAMCWKPASSTAMNLTSLNIHSQNIDQIYQAYHRLIYQTDYSATRGSEDQR